MRTVPAEHPVTAGRCGYGRAKNLTKSATEFDEKWDFLCEANRLNLFIDRLPEICGRKCRCGSKHC